MTILDDPEFIDLCQNPQGREAFALFCALLSAAKVQDNGGRFTEADVVLAYMVRWPHDAFSAALNTLLNVEGEWIKRTTKGIEIRSFQKWNKGWGGPRKGAGRPTQKNQDEIKSESSGIQDAHLVSTSATATASASVPDTVENSASETDACADPPTTIKTKRPRAPRPGDPLWDAIMLLFHPSGLPSDHRPRIGKAVKALLELNATPEELKRRYENAHHNWSGCTITIESIIRNWDQLAERSSPARNGSASNPAARREQKRADTYAREGPLPILNPDA